MRLPIHTATATLLLLSPVHAALAQAPIDTAMLGSQLPALLTKRHVTTIGAAIIRGGRVAWTGVSGLQGPGQPATPATLFNINSMTKQITTETILRLVVAGKLSLDERMAPTWVDPDVAGDPRHLALTPRIALSNQTGFPNWREERADKKLAFEFDPGTRFGYSGEGFNYAARFAEKRTGVGFEALADRYVLGPLGMKSTAYTTRGWMQGRVVTPTDSLGNWVKPDLRAEGAWNAADDVFSTVGDYATFMTKVMKGDGLGPKLTADRFRIHVSADAMFPCRAKPVERCPTHAGYALGWARFDYGPRAVIWHAGDDPGEHSLAYFYLGTGNGVVVFVNGANGRAAVRDALDLLDRQSPIPTFARAHLSPVAVWLRALFGD